MARGTERRKTKRLGEHRSAVFQFHFSFRKLCPKPAFEFSMTGSLLVLMKEHGAVPFWTSRYVTLFNGG